MMLDPKREDLVAEVKRWMQMDQRLIEIFTGHVDRLVGACNEAIASCEDGESEMPSATLARMKSAVVAVTGDGEWTRRGVGIAAEGD